MTLYVVKDGIKNVATVINSSGNRILGTNYFVLTYDFKSNEGYIDLKKPNYWRLYTQIGQRAGQNRYYSELTFERCIERLKDLKGDDLITVCDLSEVENIFGEKTNLKNGLNEKP